MVVLAIVLYFINNKIFFRNAVNFDYGKTRESTFMEIVLNLCIFPLKCGHKEDSLATLETLFTFFLLCLRRPSFCFTDKTLQRLFKELQFFSI